MSLAGIQVVPAGSADPEPWRLEDVIGEKAAAKERTSRCRCRRCLAMYPCPICGADFLGPGPCGRCVRFVGHVMIRLRRRQPPPPPDLRPALFRAGRASRDRLSAASDSP